MKATSDNEFDNAFKSSFEDFEVEPTAKSWENIAAQLDEKPKGKRLPIFWFSAAATVIAILSVGIILYQKPSDDIINLRSEKKSTDLVIDDEQSNPQYSNNEASTAINNDANLTPIGDKEAKVASSVIKNSTKTAGIKVIRNQEINSAEKNILPDATITPKENVLVVKKVNNVIAETKPVRKPTVTERMIAEEEAKKVSLNNNQTALAINTSDENLNIEGATSDRKLKIKSVGDLVNFIVGQVDKRDEKIIKLSKTDESDNEITGINLGLFKFRKAEK